MAIFFAWVASVAFGAEAVIGKLTSKYSISNPWLFNFFWSLFIALMILPFALHYGIVVPQQWSNLVLGGLFYALGSILYILMVYQLDVSVIGPMFSFRTAFVVILAWLMLGETLSVAHLGLIAVIFVGGFFVGFDEKLKFKSFFQLSTITALVATLAIALQSIYINRASAEVGYWTTSLWVPLLAQLFLLPTLFFCRGQITKVSLKSYGTLFLMAMIGTLGTLAAVRAWQDNVAITSAIISLPISMVIAFILSRFKPSLMEHHSYKVYAVRFVAAAIMITAAIRLS